MVPALLLLPLWSRVPHHRQVQPEIAEPVCPPQLPKQLLCSQHGHEFCKMAFFNTFPLAYHMQELQQQLLFVYFAWVE